MSSSPGLALRVPHLAGQPVAGIAAIVLVIAFFLPWFKVDVSIAG